MYRSFLGLVLRVMLLLYRFLRPFFVAHPGPTCRFIPTCSVYGLHAVQRYGLWKGGKLTFKRLLRCHPWGREGVDFPEQSARLGPDSSSADRG